MKKIKTILSLIVILAIAAAGYLNKDIIYNKAQEFYTYSNAKKGITDLEKCREEFEQEYTDRTRFDDMLRILYTGKGNLYQLDIERKGEEAYNRSVFFKYSGIEDKDKIKYVSAIGPSWEETVPNDLLDFYPKEKFFAIFVLANSESDAKDICKQMKKNLKPWDWEPVDYIPDGETSGLCLDVPYGDHIEITENDLHFHRNGRYVLVSITDEEAIKEGTMQSQEYYEKLLAMLIDIVEE